MASERTKDISFVLTSLGSKGKFQILQTIVLALLNLPLAFQLLSQVFTNVNVPHQCAAPHNVSGFLSPYDNYDNVTADYEQCEIVIKTNGTVLRRDKCLFGYDYEFPIDTSAVSQFDLVCDRASLNPLSQTILIGGQGVGAVIGSALSDRFGRKPVAVLTIFLTSPIGVLIAFAPNYAVFAILKFVVGAVQQCSIIIVITLLIEMFPPMDRRLSGFLIGVNWSVGMVAMALVAYLTRTLNWQLIQIVFSLSGLSAIVMWWYTEESICWLMANGKKKEAIKYIERAAKMNKKNAEEITQVLEHHDDAHVETQVLLASKRVESESFSVEPSVTNLSILTLFKVKWLLFNLVLMALLWFVTVVAYFVVYLTSSSLSGDRIVNFTLTALMEVPSAILLYFTLNRIGRKGSAQVLLVLQGVGLLTAGILKSFEPTQVVSAFALICYMISMLGSSGNFHVNFFFTSELFPTNVRNQVVGICSFVGRIGGMLAPFTGVMSAEATWSPGLLVCIVSLLLAFLITFLPETTGRDLPTTTDDILSWSREKKAKKEPKESI